MEAATTKQDTNTAHAASSQNNAASIPSAADITKGRLQTNQEQTNKILDRIRSGVEIAKEGDRGFQVRALQLSTKEYLQKNPEQFQSFCKKNIAELVNCAKSSRTAENIASYLRQNSELATQFFGSSIDSQKISGAEVRNRLRELSQGDAPLPSSLSKILLDNFRVDGAFGLQSKFMVQAAQAALNSEDSPVKVDGKIGKITIAALDRAVGKVAYRPELESRITVPPVKPTPTVTPQPIAVPAPTTDPVAAVISKHEAALSKWTASGPEGKPIVSDSEVAKVKADLHVALKLKAEEQLQIACPPGETSALTNDRLHGVIIDTASGSKKEFSYHRPSNSLEIGSESLSIPAPVVTSLEQNSSGFQQQAAAALAPYLANGALTRFGDENIVTNEISSLSQAPLLPHGVVATVDEVNGAVAKALLPEGYAAKLRYNLETLSVFDGEGALGGVVLHENSPVAEFRYQPLLGTLHISSLSTPGVTPQFISVSPENIAQHLAAIRSE